MKKVILLTSFLLIASSPTYAKSNKGAVKAFGDAVTGTVKKNVSKNVKSGFYGRSTMDALKEEAPVVAKTPEPVKIEEVTSGMPLDMNLIKRNQERENYLANGLFFMKKEFYDRAVTEFNKAKNIYNSEFIDRWIEVANSKIEAIKMNKVIEDLKAEVDSLKVITTK
jgi:hypothetical protein